MSFLQSTNGSDQDPWGRPGSSGNSDNSAGSNNQNNKPKSEQSPPDLEEVFNNLLKKISGFGGNKNSRNSNNGFKFSKKLIGIIVIVLVGIYIAKGFYTIKEAERGVLLRFGEVTKIVQPGLNWRFSFIDDVIPVNVERVSELKTGGSMLTQDENMVKVEMTVQYRIKDPAKYLFSVVKADDSLNQATDSALRYVVGHMDMNGILTTGRSVVREDTWKTLEKIIDVYDMGLDIVDVNFQSARPPEEVKDAFDDAIKAQEDEQRYIREAEAYAREREPIARGNAQRIIESANAYQQQVVLDAKGEAERFTYLIPEFRKNPQIMRERLYLQSMEKIMAKTPKIILDGKNSNNLNVLPLDKVLDGLNGAKNITATEKAEKSENKSVKAKDSSLNDNGDVYRDSLHQDDVIFGDVYKSKDYSDDKAVDGERKGRFN